VSGLRGRALPAIPVVELSGVESDLGCEWDGDKDGNGDRDGIVAAITALLSASLPTPLQRIVIIIVAFVTRVEPNRRVCK